MKQEVEPDDFLNGLSLGIWDEEFGYYLPAELANKPKTPEGVSACHDSVSKPISIISNVVEVEFGEPDITTTENFRSGEW